MINIVVMGEYLIAEGASYEQSRWLGEQGWWYSGPKSAGYHAPRLRALGLTGHVRYLPISEKTTAMRVLEVPHVRWSAQAREIVFAAREHTQASREASSAFEVPAPEGLAYRAYQCGGVEAAWKAWEQGARGILIGDEMGLGKTMQAIGLVAKVSPARVLILCLASIRENWRRELAKWLPERAAAVTDNAGGLADITIVSYSSLVGQSSRAKALRASLVDRTWDMLVCDEAHTLKNERSQTSRAVLGEYSRGALTAAGIVQRAKFTVILTGTPIQNKVREAIPLLRAVGLVGETADLGNEGKFLYRYCDPQKVWTGSRYVQTFDGSARLDELQTKLRASGRFVRRLKRDVATELPPKLRSLIVVGEERRDSYADKITAVQDFDTVSNLLTQIASFDEISAYRAELAESKAPHVVEHVRDLLEELGPAGKLIVFGHHQTMLNALSVAFGSIAIRIDGQTPADARQSLVDRFQTDPAVRVAILSTRAAGTGLTLTAAATVVFAEADWNPAQCLQAEDRAHRIGQDADSVTVHYVVINGTLDAHVVRVMATKMDVADRALDKAPAEAHAAPPPADPAPAAESDPRAPQTVTLRHKDRDYEYVISSDDQIAAIGEALLTLANYCDGARQLDGSGFNKLDAGSPFVSSLVAAAAAGALTAKQAAWAMHAILPTYKNTQIAHLAERIWINNQ